MVHSYNEMLAGNQNVRTAISHNRDESLKSNAEEMLISIKHSQTELIYGIKPE